MRNTRSPTNAVPATYTDNLLQEIISLEVQDITQLNLSISRLSAEDFTQLTIRMEAIRTHMNHVRARDHFKGEVYKLKLERRNMQRREARKEKQNDIPV